MRDFLDIIHERILVYDGSKGYLLQKLGLKGGECGELWNVTNREAVRDVYRQYREAGADVLQTNTFPGNRLHLEKYSLGDRTYEINYWGTRLAREVAGEDRFVAASIGPTGILLEPSGALTFERAYDIFSEQVKAVTDGGADVINFETFTDVAEMRAALLAARENSRLPVICSMAFEKNGRTLMGTDPLTAVAILKSMGAEMVGTNCSFGAVHMLEIVKAMHCAGSGFLSVKPNAGLPEVEDGRVRYNETPGEFAAVSAEFVKYGARLVGGCCGTTPEYIRAVRAVLEKLRPEPAETRIKRAITSGTKSLGADALDASDIGRLDAGSDKVLLAELNKGNFSYVEDAVLDLSTEGHDAVYINVDAAEGGDLLQKVVNSAQGYIREPLIIETSKPSELEKALRIYRGVAGVIIGDVPDALNEELMKPVNKYGSVVLRKL
jgi:5-methyltetrahydrofolate--homocysteine methyltransferase